MYVHFFFVSFLTKHRLRSFEFDYNSPYVSLNFFFLSQVINKNTYYTFPFDFYHKPYIHIFSSIKSNTTKPLFFLLLLYIYDNTIEITSKSEIIDPSLFLYILFCYKTKRNIKRWIQFSINRMLFLSIIYWNREKVISLNNRNNLVSIDSRRYSRPQHVNANEKEEKRKERKRSMRICNCTSVKYTRTDVFTICYLETHS